MSMPNDTLNDEDTESEFNLRRDVQVINFFHLYFWNLKISD